MKFVSSSLSARAFCATSTTEGENVWPRTGNCGMLWEHLPGRYLEALHPGDPGGHMAPIILQARVRDAEALLKLQYLCYQTEAALYDDYTIAPLTQSFADLLSEYDTHSILVARLGEEIVGSVRGHLCKDTCHIGRLIVHPRLQRRGLGIKLMYAIEEYFSNATRYELFTGYRSEANLHLYRKLGYTLFREEMVSPQLRLVFLEKQRVPNPS